MISQAGRVCPESSLFNPRLSSDHVLTTCPTKSPALIAYLRLACMQETSVVGRISRNENIIVSNVRTSRCNRVFLECFTIVMHAISRRNDSREQSRVSSTARPNLLSWPTVGKGTGDTTTHPPPTIQTAAYTTESRCVPASPPHPLVNHKPTSCLLDPLDASRCDHSTCEIVAVLACFGVGIGVNAG